MVSVISRRVMLGVGLAGLARPAFAHAILIDSAPAIGASVPPGETAIRLRFNSRIDARRSRVTLIGPDGVSRVVETRADAVGVELLGSATLLPGAQVLRWQVLAVDGHITRGDVAFRVEAR